MHFQEWEWEIYNVWFPMDLRYNLFLRVKEKKKERDVMCFHEVFQKKAMYI